MQARRSGLNVDNYTDRELELYFFELFQMADANGDGVIDPAEAASLLELCGFRLNTRLVGEASIPPCIVHSIYAVPQYTSWQP